MSTPTRYTPVPFTGVPTIVGVDRLVPDGVVADLAAGTGLCVADDLGATVDFGAAVDFAVATGCPARLGRADVGAIADGFEARREAITMPTITPAGRTNHSRRHQGFFPEARGCIGCGSCPGYTTYVTGIGGFRRSFTLTSRRLGGARDIRHMTGITVDRRERPGDPADVPRGMG